MRRQERVGVWAYTPVAPIIVARKHDFPQCLGWYALQIIYPVIWIIGLAVLPILLCLAYVQSHISRRLWFKRLVRRWRLRKSNKSFLRHIVQPVQTSLQIRGKADTERSPSPPTDLFFGKLPPEIRRSILIYAFGDRVVHLHIEYFRPSEAVRRRQAGQGMMRRAITKAAFASHTRHWRWHSRLCTSMPGSDFRESRSPDWMRDDPCLGPTLFGGSSYIVHVGVTGWLLTCRQAYLEGTAVLHTTNTLKISHPRLVKDIQRILPANMMSSLTSLEIVLGRNGSPPAPLSQNDFSSPLFPSLNHLRIRCTATPLYSNHDGVPPGRYGMFIGWQDFADHASRRLFPYIDRFIATIAPLTADIVVAGEEVPWQILTRTAGDTVEKLVRSEPWETKHWRQIPVVEHISEQSDSSVLEQGDQMGRAPGYWVLTQAYEQVVPWQNLEDSYPVLPLQHHHFI